MVFTVAVFSSAGVVKLPVNQIFKGLLQFAKNSYPFSLNRL